MTVIAEAIGIDNYADLVVCPKCRHGNRVLHVDEDEISESNLSDDCKYITAETTCTQCKEVLQFHYTIDKWGNTHI